VRSIPGLECHAPEAIAREFASLVAAELAVIGGRTVETPNGHLGIMTLKERSGPVVEFWAGVALRADPAEALFDAAVDALLAPWHHSAVVAGAARLVAEGSCSAAMVIDETGVTTYGPPTDFPPLGGPGIKPEPGARLATRTVRGEFRALSLGGASVMLSVVPDTHSGRRVERWFEALDVALD
jgi:hypothetical protein